MKPNKPGRPRTTGYVQKRRTVSIDDATAEKLRKYGDGSISLGIRRAAELIPEKEHGNG